MINENIRRARKAKGISQEELAVQLNVVRQTISKWENGLSVPDADVLIRIADLLGVSVGELLGLGGQDDGAQSLTEKLARLNEQLAASSRRERLTRRADQKRGLILFLAFAAALVAFSIKSEAVSIALCSGCVLAALAVLYRNLALLTSVTAERADIRPLRAVTIFDIAVIAIVAAVVALDRTALSAISEEGEKALAMALTILLMLFGGSISPRLPFNRHTGLRLPWTVADEDAWNLAHRVLGYISLPAALLYLAAAWTIDDFKLVSLAAVGLWVGIPGMLSLVFFQKKMRGKL